MSSAHYPAVAAGNKGMSRRDFLKLMAAAGTVMTFAPFVDWGKFLPNNRANGAEKTKIEIRGGEPSNIYSFKVNHSEVVIYPKTDDPVLNTEAFRTWQLIRLPLELGGGKNDVSAFRLYSMVCLHLWCLWRYESKLNMIACPCHASAYDPLTGKAYAGPASLQSPPSNVLPRLDLEADANGDLWILPPTWDARKNGVVGYGRHVA
ncbi:QcrA and Rieske domain-containing protein [Candidatus Nitrososphaera gargensis]|nr:Rieske 2Fe-2S domain-containing protein [Candidatus Nitrososphaera gargensis]